MKAGELSRYRPVGSVEDAKKAMLEAGEQPQPGTYAKAKESLLERVSRGQGGNSPVVQEVLVLPPTSPTPTQVAGPPEPPPQPVAPVATMDEHGETDQFSYSIYQEGGQWVGQIKYKNGAGSEKFVAPSKSALTLKLLEGKAYGTLRVREAVRREKLGAPQLEKGVLLPPGMTLEEYNAMPEKVRQHQDEILQVAQGLEFRQKHPEYYNWDENGVALINYLTKHNAPATVRNLEIAFEDLSADGLIIPPPQPEPKEIAVTPAPKVEDSTPEPVPPTPVPTSVAPVQEVPIARKRGTTGLQPGHSSSVEEPIVEPRELSERELRALPTDELKRIANADRVARRGMRRG